MQRTRQLSLTGRAAATQAVAREQTCLWITAWSEIKHMADPCRLRARLPIFVVAALVTQHSELVPGLLP
jgi:hypothetical protein